MQRVGPWLFFPDRNLKQKTDVGREELLNLSPHAILLKTVIPHSAAFTHTEGGNPSLAGVKAAWGSGRVIMYHSALRSQTNDLSHSA